VGLLVRSEYYETAQGFRILSIRCDYMESIHLTVQGRARNSQCVCGGLDSPAMPFEQGFELQSLASRMSPVAKEDDLLPVGALLGVITDSEVPESEIETFFRIVLFLVKPKKIKRR
jgi:hypothetical protein